MKPLSTAPRFLAVAVIGLGLCSSAWAQTAPRPRDLLPENLPEAPEGTPPSSPSTRLEVPAGADIKITIEVVSKSSPAPAPPVVAERPPHSAPARPAVARRSLPTVESIKPTPLPPVPDDPPPHEGAMFQHPYPIEPADLLTVEVLEALPGRPISGERLVRTDGMISLSFYGEVYVRGLTIHQAKEKIILHLRKFLPDEVLGLVEQHENGDWEDLEPRDSNRVFVEITAYNSKNYFIQGDVAAPGRLPWTAHETILDAVNFARGFNSSADPKNIRLVRPGREGKPSKVYKVDYEAILERGDTAQNYQLFPGDRLIVGRNPVIKTTVEADDGSTKAVKPPKARTSTKRKGRNRAGARSQPRVKWSHQGERAQPGQ